MFERKKGKSLGGLSLFLSNKFWKRIERGFRWRLKFLGIRFLWICEQRLKEEEKGKSYSRLINFGRGSKEGWFRGVRFLWILSSREVWKKKGRVLERDYRYSCLINFDIKYDIIARRSKSVCYLLFVPLCSWSLYIIWPELRTRWRSN